MGWCAGRPRLAGAHGGRAGPGGHLLPGLAMDAAEPPTRAEVDDALAPRRPGRRREPVLAPPQPRRGRGRGRRRAPGRPALLHHHDLPWQRPHLAHLPPPPDDPAWAHVTINELSRAELAARGITATTIYNAFEPDPATGDRAGVRAGARRRRRDAHSCCSRRGRWPGRTSRARMALAEAVGGTYWLLGPAEDGYGPELERLVARAAAPWCSAGPGPLFRRRRLRGL